MHDRPNMYKTQVHNTTLHSTSVHQNTVHKYKVKVNNKNSRLQVESQNKKQRLTAILHNVKVDSQDQ